MPSRFQILRYSDAVVLRSRGPLVGDGARLLRQRALRAVAGGHDLALDLTRVPQIDAYGIGTLAAVCAAARRSRRRIFLAGASDRVRRVLRLTNLDAFIPELGRAATPSRLAYERRSTMRESEGTPPSDRPRRDGTW